MNTRHPIHHAEHLGQQGNGVPGTMVYRAMEVSFLLRATKQSNYEPKKDSRIIVPGTKPRVGPRLLQHIMLIAPPGVYKSGITEDFLKDCCGAFDLMEVDAPSDKYPPYVDLGSGISWERIRGSASAMGEPIPPLLIEAAFGYMSELMEFLGSGPERNDKIVRLNKMSEEGRMSVSLIKMSEMEKSKRLEFANKVNAIPGLHYSVKHGGFTYRNRTCLVGCTTELESKDAIQWKKNGFLSRFYTIEWEPDDDAYGEYMENPWRVVDRRGLCDLNLQIWRTPFPKDIPLPPPELSQMARTWVMAEGRKIAKNANVHLRHVINARHHLCMAHAMTASAIARIFERRAPDDITPITSLSYSEQDLAFAKSYITPILSSINIAVSDPSTTRTKDVPEATEKRFVAFLRSLSGGEDAVDHFKKSEFVKWATGESRGGDKLKPSSVGQEISKLRKAGIIMPGAYGAEDIWVEDTYVSSHGLLSTTELETRRAEEKREADSHYLPDPEEKRLGPDTDDGQEEMVAP